MSIKKVIDIQGKIRAPKGQYNDFGKFKYRSCEDILEALKPLLTEHELAVHLGDEVVQIGERYYVRATVTLIDENGKAVGSSTAYAREAENKTGMDASQITGSASSYARKYALSGLLALDDGQDPDSAKPDSAKPAPRPERPATARAPGASNDKQEALKKVKWLMNKMGMDNAQMKDYLDEKYGKAFSRLTQAEIEDLILHLQDLAK